MVDESRFGEVIWAKYQGFPYWPCYIYAPKYTPKNVRKIQGSKKDTYVIYFYGDGNFAVVDSSKIISWNDATDDMRAGKIVQGSRNRPLTAKLRESFIQGLKIAKEERLRDPMDRCAWNHENLDSDSEDEVLSVASGKEEESEESHASGEEGASGEEEAASGGEEGAASEEEEAALHVVKTKKRMDNLEIDMDDSGKAQVPRKDNMAPKKNKRKMPSSPVDVRKSCRTRKAPKRLDATSSEDNSHPTGKDNGRVRSATRERRHEKIEPCARSKSEQMKNTPLGFSERGNRVMVANDHGYARYSGDASDIIHCRFKKPNRVEAKMNVAGSQMQANVVNDYAKNCRRAIEPGVEKNKPSPQKEVPKDHVRTSKRNLQKKDSQASQAANQSEIQGSNNSLYRNKSTAKSSGSTNTCQRCAKVPTVNAAVQCKISVLCVDAFMQTGNIAETYANLEGITESTPTQKIIIPTRCRRKAPKIKHLKDSRLAQIWANRLFEIARSEYQDRDEIMEIFHEIAQVTTTHSILAKTKLPTAINYFRKVKNAEIVKMASKIRKHLKDAVLSGLDDASDDCALNRKNSNLDHHLLEKRAVPKLSDISSRPSKALTMKKSSGSLINPATLIDPNDALTDDFMIKKRTAKICIAPSNAPICERQNRPTTNTSSNFDPTINVEEQLQQEQPSINIAEKQQPVQKQNVSKASMPLLLNPSKDVGKSLLPGKPAAKTNLTSTKAANTPAEKAQGFSSSEANLLVKPRVEAEVGVMQENVSRNLGSLPGHARRTIDSEENTSEEAPVPFEKSKQDVVVVDGCKQNPKPVSNLGIEKPKKTLPVGGDASSISEIRSEAKAYLRHGCAKVENKKQVHEFAEAIEDALFMRFKGTTPEYWTLCRAISTYISNSESKSKEVLRGISAPFSFAHVSLAFYYA